MIPPVIAAWAVTATSKRVLRWARVGFWVALVVGIAFAGNRVTVWHASHLALQATETALATSRAEVKRCAAREAAAQQAWLAAAAMAESTAARDRETAERIERELQTRLADADARGRDLARRLQDYRVRACSDAVPGAAGATGELDAAGGEPGGDGGAVAAAEEAVYVACARDAERLDAWREWWSALRASRF